MKYLGNLIHGKRIRISQLTRRACGYADLNPNQSPNPESGFGLLVLCNSKYADSAF